MAEIIPAVLPKNYEDMKDKLALVRGIAPVVQIDLCDGVFVPNQTWPFTTGGANDFYFQSIMNEQSGMPFWEDMDFELDLMVSDAVENFDIYTKLGPRRVVFHIEAVGDLDTFKDFLEGIDMYMRETLEIGVAISVNTPVETIFSLVPHVDFVQVMGIERVGFQGEEFTTDATLYVKTLKEKFPELIVSVDGSVNFDTAPELVDAGVDRLVVGSAIFNSDDIIGTIEDLKNI